MASTVADTSMSTNQTKFLEIRRQMRQGIFADVQNYNDNEDATCIEIALLLEASAIKRWLLLPLLSILTLFYFPIKLYWNRRMQGDWLYSTARDLNTATHIYIVGRGKPQLTQAPCRQQ
jgi:hypothetical protein